MAYLDAFGSMGEAVGFASPTGKSATGRFL